jgi:hypothetical protein
MGHEELILSYLSLTLAMFAAFGMQRTSLLLSREANVSKKVTAELMPLWFPVVWLPRVAKWALLGYIAISWGWWPAFGLLCTEIVLALRLPIPYRLYVPAFRRRIEQIRKTDPELAYSLEAILDASKLCTHRPRKPE